MISGGNTGGESNCIDTTDNLLRIRVFRSESGSECDVSFECFPRFSFSEPISAWGASFGTNGSAIQISNVQRAISQ